ncbi:transposase DDE domain protein [Leptospira borgpetersenii str. Noumea 25]|nr:transposase DDE domain protein [Leptospira borgpetersenii str. Noumea 25]
MKKPLIGKYKGKSRRWVVERTNSWHNRFRAILIRWERKSENYLASLYLASSIIAFNFFDTKVLLLMDCSISIVFAFVKLNSRKNYNFEKLYEFLHSED